MSMGLIPQISQTTSALALACVAWRYFARPHNNAINLTPLHSGCHARCVGAAGDA